MFRRDSDKYKRSDNRSREDNGKSRGSSATNRFGGDSRDSGNSGRSSGSTSRNRDRQRDSSREYKQYSGRNRDRGYDNSGNRRYGNRYDQGRNRNYGNSYERDRNRDRGYGRNRNSGNDRGSNSSYDRSRDRERDLGNGNRSGNSPSNRERGRSSRSDKAGVSGSIRGFFGFGEKSGKDSRSRRSSRGGSGSGGSRGSLTAVDFFSTDDGRKSSRDAILLLVLAIFALVLFIRLFDLQVVQAEEYRQNAASQRTLDEVVYAKRGTIYDRNGNILATSVDATTIYANPSEIDDPKATSEILADVLGGDASDYLDKISGDNTFVYILRKGDVSKAEALQKKYDELQQEVDTQKAATGTEQTNALDGIYYLDDTKRVYPYGETAGQIIGYVGVDGDGLSGLELQYNDILKGTDGHRVVEQGKGGIQIPGGTQVDEPAVDGTDIMISIDIDLQQYAEDVLADAVNTSNANSGNLMIIDGSTGEIYATASTPYYDLNDVSSAEEGASTLKSVSSTYEPGSTFKSVTASVLLAEGAAEPDESITVPGSLQFGQWTITDAHDHGTETLTFKEIIEQSSNIGVSILEDRLDSETFYKYLEMFGFGKATGVDYPGESDGILADYQDWSEVQEANISFGQGISVTTIQM
ncbi:MAG: penicillin-binding transpeptidase domain-containing protein, partial [Coriobacteriales bacterium]